LDAAVKPNELLARLMRCYNFQPDAIPSGWKDSEGWAKAWGISRTHASRLLRNGAKKGLMQGRKFRVPAGKRTTIRWFYAEK